MEDLISSSFQPSPSNYMLLKFYYQSLRCWVHLSSGTFYYFKLSYTKWSFAYLASRHFLRKQASRIGGHMKYVTTYRDCLAISLTLSGGVNTFTWSRVPLVNSMTSLLWISVITNVTPKHAIPWDMGSAGKICINYAGSLSVVKC